jgi:hypothetical protein
MAMPVASAEQVLLAFGLATVLGALMALAYRLSTGGNYNADIAQSQIVLSALMSLVMLVVGDNLSRAFGAVGILSVMRFKVKMQGAGEALTLLGGVVVGMACGVGMYRQAVLGAILLSLLNMALAKLFAPVPAADRRVEVE